MLLDSFGPSSFDDTDSTNLTEAQKTSLIAAWSIFKSNMSENSRMIFAEFYERNPEYLRLFEGLENAALHRHTEEVLKCYTALIENGLREPIEFNSELARMSKFHRSLSGVDSAKLNQILKRVLLEQVHRHKTKTLEDALDAFFLQIELTFDCSCNDEELWVNKILVLNKEFANGAFYFHGFRLPLRLQFAHQREISKAKWVRFV